MKTTDSITPLLFIFYLLSLLRKGSADYSLGCYYEKCYYIHDDEKSWYDAQQYCQQRHDGSLVEIHSEEFDTFLNGQINRRPNGRYRYWLGARERDLGDLQWIQTKSRVSNSDINWSSSPELHGACGYITAPTRSRSYFWSNLIKRSDCFHAKESICQVCDSNGCTYHANPVKSNWFEARVYCKNNGYDDLLYLDNSSTLLDKRGDLRNLASDTDYWIGAHSSEWKWQNGSEMIYSYWDMDQPSSEPERCLEMMLNGGWNDAPCDDERPYICSSLRRGTPGPVPPLPTSTIFQRKTADVSRPISVTDEIAGHTESTPGIISSTPRTPYHNQQNRIAMIAGIAVGATVFILVLLTAALLVYRKKKKKNKESILRYDNIVQHSPTPRKLQREHAENTYADIDGVTENTYAELDDLAVDDHKSKETRNEFLSELNAVTLHHKADGEFADIYALPNKLGKTRSRESNEPSTSVVSPSGTNKVDSMQMSSDKTSKPNSHPVNLDDDTLIVENEVYDSFK